MDTTKEYCIQQAIVDLQTGRSPSIRSAEKAYNLVESAVVIRTSPNLTKRHVNGTVYYPRGKKRCLLTGLRSLSRVGTLLTTHNYVNSLPFLSSQLVELQRVVTTG
jgi:hypothetical protein